MIGYYSFIMNYSSIIHYFGFLNSINVYITLNNSIFIKLVYTHRL